MSAAASVVKLELQPFERHPNFNLGWHSALGITQVLCGLLSMALGVGAICTWASGYYIAYGIWCGFMFTVTGGIGIGAARHKFTYLILLTMVLSIICACLGVIQMCLGIVSAYNDSVPVRHDVVSGVFPPSSDYVDYDIYYFINNPMIYVCAGQNASLSWRYAWGPVDILLLVTGFIEIIAAIITASHCCSVVCCGIRTIELKEGAGHTGTLIGGYSNDGYTMDSRTSPPMYKNYL